MPKYKPIHIGVQLKASLSDLADFAWSASGIIAFFYIPDRDGCLMRVSFDRPCIVRLVDEMPLSTETDDGPNDGLVREHFAYQLEGAAFARSQSSEWQLAAGPVSHYRFVTGNTCMDVLSAAKPSFLVVGTEPERQKPG